MRRPESTVTISTCREIANHETCERGRHQPASRRSLYCAASGTVRRGLPIATYGQVDDLLWDCCLTVLWCLCVVVSLQGIGKRGVHHEGGARDTILFCCPGSEVGHVTSFGAEGAPGVTFPCAGLVTERTSHARHCTTPNPWIGPRSTRTDLLGGGDLQ